MCCRDLGRADPVHTARREDRRLLAADSGPRVPHLAIWPGLPRSALLALVSRLGTEAASTALAPPLGRFPRGTPPVLAHDCLVLGACCPGVEGGDSPLILGECSAESPFLQVVLSIQSGPHEAQRSTGSERCARGRRLSAPVPSSHPASRAPGCGGGRGRCPHPPLWMCAHAPGCWALGEQA